MSLTINLTTASMMINPLLGNLSHVSTLQNMSIKKGGQACYFKVYQDISNSTSFLQKVQLLKKSQEYSAL
jgi:hypothetical protein